MILPAPFLCKVFLIFIPPASPSSLLSPPGLQKQSDCQSGSMVNTQPALYKLAPAGHLPAAVLLLQFPGSRRQWLQQPSWVHTMATCWQGLWAYRSYLIVFLLPIFLLPLPILVPTKVRTWGSGHSQAPKGWGEGIPGQSWASLGPA